jgi:hypothetical protein
VSDWIGKLFRLRENVESIDSHALSFGESWARSRPGLVLALAVVALLLSLGYYLRAHRRGNFTARVLLGLCRGGLLALLVVVLADPVFQIAYTHRPKPLLYVLFDGTESMAIADRLAPGERDKLDKAVERAAPAASPTGSSASSSAGAAPIPTRIEYVQALLQRPDANLLDALQQHFRVKCFQFARRDEVDVLATAAAGADPDAVDPAQLADRLTTKGQVSNFASALESLRGKHASSRLAGVVMFSDFDKNAGGEPTGSASSPAERLGVPIYAVGIGPERARNAWAEVVDLASVMRKGDKRTFNVRVGQQGLSGRTATIQATARPLSGNDEAGHEAEPIIIGSRTITLTDESHDETFDFTPPEPGLYDVTGEVLPLADETATDDNRSTRKLKVLDEYVRLLFVEYEPTWEWRFIKEVFHRDPLVGLKGFRTYLHSAHPKVKQSGELFTASLTPRSRNEFFANDVIFLGDIPAEILTKAFCDRLEEFVGDFGGGLVVMAGPRFGVGQYARVTSNPEMDASLRKIYDMLPVIVDPTAKPKEGPFRMQLTPLGRRTEFMRLAGTDDEAAGAWDNLGYLPWYQPVRALRDRTQILAIHPNDVCPEGDKQPQPIIATRTYGRKNGQVVYLGFNETWRLRRKYGEKYYQQFWGQLIHQLGFSHELGNDKRFIVKVDNDELKYFAGDRVTLSVEAYDEEFKPLDADRTTRLEYRLTRPSRSSATGEVTEELSIPLLHAGRYETQFQVFVDGPYRVSVKDPITGMWRPPITLAVSGRSPERRNAVRNVAVQNQLARATNGKAYDLTTVDQLPGDIAGLSKAERIVEVHKLWTTWPCFALVVSLMLGEWLGRKRLNLQ